MNEEQLNGAERKRRLSISQIAQMGDRGTHYVMKHSVEGVDIRTIYRRTGHLCLYLHYLLGNLKPG